jgi:hypothetical protein
MQGAIPCHLHLYYSQLIFTIMKTAYDSTLLTRYEYLVLHRHIQRDIERDADGTFRHLNPATGYHVFHEREAQIVQKALRKIREHLLTVERHHQPAPMLATAAVRASENDEELEVEIG